MTRREDDQLHEAPMAQRRVEQGGPAAYYEAGYVVAAQRGELWTSPTAVPDPIRLGMLEREWEQLRPMALWAGSYAVARLAYGRQPDLDDPAWWACIHAAYSAEGEDDMRRVPDVEQQERGWCAEMDAAWPYVVPFGDRITVEDV